jgi:glycine betaine/proline transport system permease protein
MNELPDALRLPVDRWIQTAVDWLVYEWRPAFQAMRVPIQYFLTGVTDFLMLVPFWAVIAAFGMAGLLAAGWRHGLFCVVSFFLIAAMGQWAPAMTSLAILVTAVAYCCLVGIPLGILASRSEWFWSMLRPVLDCMQTTPSFVYLVPVVMLFGIGTVPGVIATIIFAMPPVIRLTNLGLRQVSREVVEAGEAYGATEWQSLVNIRLPLALPSIMAGLNQTLLMALVMSVVISMIGAEGLGLIVLRGIGALDVGLAGVGGLSIVLMAISLDRIAQGLVQLAEPSMRTARARATLANLRLSTPSQ